MLGEGCPTRRLQNSQAYFSIFYQVYNYYLITTALKNNLIDVVLADRGFTVDKYARMAMAEVKIPLLQRVKAAGEN